MTPKQFSKRIKFGHRYVGEGEPVYTIAEVGANFDQDLEKAKEYCDIAKDIGADCIKFQSFIAEKIVSRTGFASMKLKGVHGSWGRPVDEVFRDAEFPRDWHKKISDYCKKIGIDFTSAPYDFEAVDLLVKLGVPWIKIGSGEICWPEMLKYIAKKGKPIALATGASTFSEVDEAVNAVRNTGNTDLVLMQCITNYPSKIESANINVMKSYAQMYGVIVGYSDHSPGDLVLTAAVANGAKVIEKHFTINRKGKGPDHPHSMEPHEFKEMIKKFRQIEAAMGTGEKYVVPEESETVIVQRRGLYAKRDIKKGSKIQKADVDVLRPQLGIWPKHIDSVIGTHAGRDIKKGSPIKWEDL